MRALRTELKRVLGEEPSRDFFTNYGDALVENYENAIPVALHDHLLVFELIERDMEKLVASEPGIKQPIDLYEAFGLMFRVMGRELEREAQV